MISVVLPAYNAEKYIADAIESILSQTFKCFELIIIDDGSKDATAEIVREYSKRDSRIRFYSQRNIGLVATLNKAISLSSYEIIARMDADDISLPNRFELQLMHIQNNENVGVVGGHIKLIDQNGENLGKNIYFPTSSRLAKECSKISVPVAHPAVLFKKEMFIRAGGYRREFKHAEDYDLWLRMLNICDVVNVNEVILEYRVHLKSISGVNRLEQRASTLVSLIVNMYGLSLNGFTDDPIENFDRVVKQLPISSYEPILNFQVESYKIKDRSHCSLLIDFFTCSIGDRVLRRAYLNNLIFFIKDETSIYRRITLYIFLLVSFIFFPVSWIRKYNGNVI